MIANKCPKCNEDTNVLDSRPRPELQLLYRRRQCKVCKHRFSTFEITEKQYESYENIRKSHEVIMKSIKGEYGVPQ